MITITPKLAGLVATAAVLVAAPAAFASEGHKSVKAHKTVKTAPRSVKAAAWSFPKCSGGTEYEYVYSGDPCTSASPPAAAGGTTVPAPAVETGVVSRSQVGRRSAAVCNGEADYEYVYSGCPS